MPDLLTVEGLGAGYGAVQVLREVSLTLGPGEGLAVLGPNGAGKTTTLETCEGYRRPQQGSVRVLVGDAPGTVAVSPALRGALGVVPGRTALLLVSSNETFAAIVPFLLLAATLVFLGGPRIRAAAARRATVDRAAPSDASAPSQPRRSASVTSPS